MAPRPQAIPAFPPETGFHYVAEGNANVVYRPSIHVQFRTIDPTLIGEYGSGTPPPTTIDDNPVPLWERPYEDRLVRFRKDLPTTVPCAKAQSDWERLIKPLFPKHQLVDQSLVRLRPGDIIPKLNDELRGWEIYDYPTKGSLVSWDYRPTKRNGVYLADDDHALLVTDMSPHGNEETIIEFKPKWLLQSPSAPKDSTRCRNCAKMARTNALLPPGQAPKRFYCPLDMTSKSPRDLLYVSDIMLQPDYSADSIARFAHWLNTTNILTSIKARQQELDPVGVMAGDGNDEKLRAAMTLRDCTVFVKTHSYKHPSTWEAKMGDLDLKSAAKLAYWRSIEQPLIEEGWYEWKEKPELKQPNRCHLNPHRSYHRV